RDHWHAEIGEGNVDPVIRCAANVMPVRSSGPAVPVSVPHVKSALTKVVWTIAWVTASVPLIEFAAAGKVPSIAMSAVALLPTATLLVMNGSPTACCVV